MKPETARRARSARERAPTLRISVGRALRSRRRAVILLLLGGDGRGAVKPSTDVAFWFAMGRNFA
jgi:hypothetical protein